MMVHWWTISSCVPFVSICLLKSCQLIDTLVCHLPLCSLQPSKHSSQGSRCLPWRHLCLTARLGSLPQRSQAPATAPAAPPAVFQHTSCGCGNVQRGALERGGPQVPGQHRAAAACTGDSGRASVPSPPGAQVQPPCSCPYLTGSRVSKAHRCCLPQPRAARLPPCIPPYITPGLAAPPHGPAAARMAHLGPPRLPVGCTMLGTQTCAHS